MCLHSAIHFAINQSDHNSNKVERQWCSQGGVSSGSTAVRKQMRLQCRPNIFAQVLGARCGRRREVGHNPELGHQCMIVERCEGLPAVHRRPCRSNMDPVILGRRRKVIPQRIAYHAAQIWTRGPMDKASAYGAGDCRFESCRVQFAAPRPVCAWCGTMPRAENECGRRPLFRAHQRM